MSKENANPEKCVPTLKNPPPVFSGYYDNRMGRAADFLANVFAFLLFSALCVGLIFGTGTIFYKALNQHSCTAEK
jgi:hypothetical protein